MAIPAMMQWLIGTWFIVHSDSPLWLKGDKTSPTLNYTLSEKKGEYRMLDETKYTKNGKHKTIAGYDHAVPNEAAAYIWKGKGMLFFATSKWRVCFQDEKHQWAVIAYSKTLFTAEGVDILCRTPTLSESTVQDIRKMMMQDSMLKKHMDGLKLIAQR